MLILERLLNQIRIDKCIDELNKIDNVENLKSATQLLRERQGKYNGN